MIDLDQLKSDWNNIILQNEALKQRNRELTRRLASERVKTHKQKLIKNYSIGYIGFAFPFFAYTMHQAFDASITLCVFYTLFGLIIGSYDIWFMNYLKRTDYMSLPTLEAIKQASKIVKYQNRATICGIISSIALLIPMFYEMYLADDMSLFYGGLAGLVLGASIGGKICYDNHMNARRMLSEIKDLDHQ